MWDLIWFGASKLIVPLLVWTAVFVLATMMIGVVTSIWCVRRLGRARAAASAPSTAIVVVLWLSLVCGLFVVPGVIALVHGVPFAVQRGLAVAIDRSAPQAAEWVTDLAASNVAALVGVTDTSTLVHVGELKGRVADALKNLGAADAQSEGFAAIRDMAVALALRSLQAALNQLPAREDSYVTWGSVLNGMKSAMATGASAFVSDTVITLHLAAWANAVWAAGLVAGCNALVIGIFFAAVRQPIIALAASRS